MPIPIPPLNGGIKPCLKAMRGPRDPFHGLRRGDSLIHWGNGNPMMLGHDLLVKMGSSWKFNIHALIIPEIGMMWNDWRSCWSTKLTTCPITLKKRQGDIKEDIESATYLQLQASWNVLDLFMLGFLWGCWMRRLVDWSDMLVCFISEYVRLFMSILANHPGPGL